MYDGWYAQYSCSTPSHHHVMFKRRATSTGVSRLQV